MKEELLSTKHDKTLNMKSVRSLLGKKVISKSGEYLGKVRDILSEDDKITGILAKRGFTRYFVDTEYINSDTDKVMLNIDPVMRLRKMHVFDSDGQKLGRVIDIERKDNSNDFSHIVIRKRIWSKPQKIEKAKIEVARKNIILK